MFPRIAQSLLIAGIAFAATHACAAGMKGLPLTSTPGTTRPAAPRPPSPPASVPVKIQKVDTSKIDAANRSIRAGQAEAAARYNRAQNAAYNQMATGVMQGTTGIASSVAERNNSAVGAGMLTKTNALGMYSDLLRNKSQQNPAIIISKSRFQPVRKLGVRPSR